MTRVGLATGQAQVKAAMAAPEAQQESIRAPEDQTWTTVQRAVDLLHHRVLDATPANQVAALQTFEAGLKSAQNELGLALDRLDQQLLREIRAWRR